MQLKGSRIICGEPLLTHFVQANPFFVKKNRPLVGRHLRFVPIKLLTKLIIAGMFVHEMALLFYIFYKLQEHSTARLISGYLERI